jgi:thiol-disulfide isomerase/thioredoxin
MRKVFKFILIIVILSFSGIAIWALYQKINVKKEALQNLRKVPKLDLLTLDNIRVSELEALTSSKPSIIVFFNSECDHCKFQIQEIEKYNQKLKEVNVLLISSEELTSLQSFASLFDFENIPSFQFLKIYEKDVYKAFGSLTVPHIFIYDKDNNLKREFKGETGLEAILQHVN